MYLLHTKTYELQRFLGDNIPAYAILSHTWGEEEVTFQDISKPTKQVTKMGGFPKIRDSCLKAWEHRLDYIWIDTCCIDRDSSAELSEAINSMYEWYRAAKVCFAYLADYLPGHDIGQSRWFRRGWTLQELLAPRKMIFVDHEWIDVGERSELESKISLATRIRVEHLKNPQDASIAQKMSWVAERETTRKEDIAYCLLGLFDVNMPLLYGEGERKAFLRLQQEIIKTSQDESIFAWTNQDLWSSGMFAQSPADFADSGDIVGDANLVNMRPPYSVTNIGLEITLDRIMGNFSEKGDSYKRELRDVTTPIACRRTKEGKDGRPLALRLKLLRPNLINNPKARDNLPRITVTMRTHLDKVSICSRYLKDLSIGKRVFVADIRCPKSGIETALRARGQWEPSTFPWIGQPQYKQPSPLFLFRLSFAISRASNLSHLKHSKSNKDEIHISSLLLKNNAIEDFQEAASGLVCQESNSAPVFVLCWRSGGPNNMPSIDVYQSSVYNRFWKRYRLDTPYALCPDSIYAAHCGDGRLIWIHMHEADPESPENAWIVDIDFAPAEGISIHGY